MPYKDPQKRREAYRKWYYAHRELAGAKSKEYHAKNPESLRAAGRRYKIKHREEINQRQRLYRKEHLTVVNEKARIWQRRWYALNRYGLSEPQYEEIKGRFERGPCEICGTEGPVVIDHAHEQKYFRGLLCIRCNRVLGFMRDNADWFDHAANYLRMHSHAAS